MKTLLAHPGTQYSHRLAQQLNRIGYLYKFVTGITFRSTGFLSQSIPSVLKTKISNRFFEGELRADQLETIMMPELIALFMLKMGKEMESVFHTRNEVFQREISNKFLERSDHVIGFDTSSWILAERAQKINKPFILDQSIAHPNEKHALFNMLHKRYPQWKEDIPQKHDALIQLEMAEHQRSTMIVVASTFTKNSLIKNGVPLEKIKLNPYGIGPLFFRKRNKKTNKKIRFAYLGTLGARKGLPFLMEVWNDNELFKMAEIWLAGPASEFAITAVTNAPGMTYKGRISYSQIPALLSSCDCLIFPSYFEGFGQVILEAMASGLPVITTEATAGPDIIENKVDGFIIPSGNKSELIEAMRTISDDPALCYQMGMLAQEKARAFSWSAYGDRWKVIIDSI